MEVVVINGSITDQEECYYIDFIKLYEPNCHRLEVIVKNDHTVHLVPHTKLPIYPNISRPSTVSKPKPSITLNEDELIKLYKEHYTKKEV